MEKSDNHLLQRVRKGDCRLAVLGLGYVGLPLAVEFGKKVSVLGFDINPQRIDELRSGVDRNHQIETADLKSARRLQFSSSPADLKGREFFIVTVPTPVDQANQPNLEPLRAASEIVGNALQKGNIVVYESTVYPGLTEEYAVPLLEKTSGLTFNRDFFCGYSPERINPGDREHTLTKIKKIVAGSTPETLEAVDALYSSIITAGTHRAPSIRVAEAAKVIENTQRDLNIALMNELALIFDRMGIDTHDVLQAAGTKWNFQKFEPGLVGGHCIGVDPYYLTHKAEKLGYRPQVILAGRRINDGMGKYIAQRTIKEMVHAGHSISGNRVTVFGLTFKEDCPDLRNSKAVDVVRELQEYEVEVQVHDALADPADAKREYGIQLRSLTDLKPAAALVVAVAHSDYRNMDVAQLRGLLGPNPILVDVKGIFNPHDIRTAGIRLWRL